MKKTFKVDGTFRSYYAATAWLNENGYSYGSMCMDMPIGIVKGDAIIAKWRNLTKSDIATLDGRITSNDFREGEVTIEIYNN